MTDDWLLTQLTMVKSSAKAMVAAKVMLAAKDIPAAKDMFGAKASC